MGTGVALYTTVYPGVEPYLGDWYRSVRAQSDQDFRLWMGLDAISAETVTDILGTDPKAVWVPARAGDSPAQIRQRALAQIVEAHEAVILVDSDDVLYPSRVARARAALQGSDLAVCALHLIDRKGLDLGVAFALSPPEGPDGLLPRYNIFGFSNTSFRSALLQQCLPIPSDVVTVDWYLATLAWLRGARLHADNEVGMGYRQHPANTARVLPPFDRLQVTRDTERVLRHYARVREAGLPPSGRLEEVGAAAAEVDTFYREVVLRSSVFDRYLQELNALEPAPYWWSCVAHPALRRLWAPARSLS